MTTIRLLTRFCSAVRPKVPEVPACERADSQRGVTRMQQNYGATNVACCIEYTCRPARANADDLLQCNEKLTCGLTLRHIEVRAQSPKCMAARSLLRCWPMNLGDITATWKRVLEQNGRVRAEHSGATESYANATVTCAVKNVLYPRHSSIDLVGATKGLGSDALSLQVATG